MNRSRLAQLCTVGTAALGLFVAVKLSTMPRPRASAPDCFSQALRPVSDKKVELPPMLVGVRKIVCIGDSITRYGVAPESSYPARLQNYLDAIFADEKIQVLNKGKDSEHSNHIMERFRKDAIESGADLIIVLVGTNDVGHGFSQGFPEGGGPDGTALEDFSSSIAKIVEMAKTSNRSLILVTPPTLFENSQCKPDLLLDRYCDSLRKIAKERDIPLCDSKKAFSEIIAAYRESTGSRDYLLTIDGVHPNSLGNKIITDCLLETLGIDGMIRAGCNHASGVFNP